MHFARPYLGRESRSMLGDGPIVGLFSLPLSLSFSLRLPVSLSFSLRARMYLRCNTYTRVKGGYAFAGRGIPTGRPTSQSTTSRRVLISVAGVPRGRPPPSWQRPSSGTTDVVELSLPTPHGCGTIFQPRLWSPPCTLLPAGSAYSYIIFAREILGLGSPLGAAHVCAHTPCVPGKNRLVTVPYPRPGLTTLSLSVALSLRGRATLSHFIRDTAD